MLHGWAKTTQFLLVPKARLGKAHEVKVRAVVYYGVFIVGTTYGLYATLLRQMWQRADSAQRQ